MIVVSALKVWKNIWKKHRWGKQLHKIDNQMQQDV